MVTYRLMTSLLTGATVTCEHLRACSFEHLCVLYSLFNGREHAEFGSDRDRQVVVEGVDWGERS